jgi:hypothetical protein
MVTRGVFLFLALAIVGGFAWAFHHDVQLGKRIGEVEMGDSSESVRELLGNRPAKAHVGHWGLLPRPAPASTCTSTTIPSFNRSTK